MNFFLNHGLYPTQYFVTTFDWSITTLLVQLQHDIHDQSPLLFCIVFVKG